MSSSLQFCFPSLLTSKPQRCRPLIGSNTIKYSRIANYKQFCSLISSPRSNLEVSWIETEGASSDELGGWFVSGKNEITSRNGVPKFVLAGVGASVVVLLAAFTYFSFSKKGLKFQYSLPFESLQEMLISSKSRKIPVQVTTKSTMLEVNPDSETKVDDNKESHPSNPKEKYMAASGKSKRIVVPVTADPNQLEALDVLKKLKIIENDACAEELCTRREYARWLVKANFMLERNPKHKIVPTMLIVGSTITAFDDVSTNDPDFLFIQALGDAGIVLSKLSTATSTISDINNSDKPEKIEFSPESYVSRFDLVNWKAMLEYPFSSEEEQMSRMKVGILDLRSSRLDASPQLLMDWMAGDKSIIRRVFGNIRRLQPDKPVTKAQAAVALTSGRMAETIKSEISRLEAEHQLRLAEMEEIRTELIRQGEIQRAWEERFNKEKERELEVERGFQLTLLELDKEKMARNEGLTKYMKQKAALDYQQKLLSGLRKEVDSMCYQLATQRANIFTEQHSLDDLLADLRNQKDAIVEVKSMLEAEKEALRILRYWVEEEAWKIHVRGTNLELAARRWKWSSDSGNLG